MSVLEDIRSASRHLSRTATMALAATAFPLVLVPQTGVTDPGVLFAVLLVAVAFLVGLLCVHASSRHLRRQMELFQHEHDREADTGRRDETTGALTRRFFLRSCEERLIALRTGEALAYLAVDLDQLKAMNDSFGHETGDAALRHLVATIRSHHPTLMVGRLGGDEFAFLLPCAGQDEAVRAAADLLEALGRPAVLSSRSLGLSATIGITMLPSHTTLLAEAMQFSDLALYEGKRSGRCRPVLFDARMLADLRHKQLIERELKVGLERDEFGLTYAPIVDGAGNVYALRAHLTWNSGWLGLVPPSTFVPIAEASLLIDRIGEHVLRRVCGEAALLGATRICIPVSACQLKRDDVVELFRTVLAETGLPPERLLAEIRNMSSLATNAGARARLAALRALGIGVSVGEVNFFLTASVSGAVPPADLVRIAPYLTRKLNQWDNENALVSALVMVAVARGLPAVADGIVTQEQMVLAKAAGCRYFAGPLIGEGLAAEAMAARMQLEAA